MIIANIPIPIGMKYFMYPTNPPSAGDNVCPKYPCLVYMTIPKITAKIINRITLPLTLSLLFVVPVAFVAVFFLGGLPLLAIASSSFVIYFLHFFNI